MSSKVDNETIGVDRSRRRSYLVKSNLQARYAVMFILINAIGIVIGYASTLLYPVSVSVGFLSVSYALFVVFMVCGIIVASILFTNRVAGPIYRLEQTLDGVLRDKHLDRIVRLRRGDELQDLAGKLTHLLQEWRLVTAADREAAQEISRKLHLVKEYLESLPENEGRQQALVLLQECSTLLEGIACAYTPEPPPTEFPSQP